MVNPESRIQKQKTHNSCADFPAAEDPLAILLAQCSYWRKNPSARLLLSAIAVGFLLLLPGCQTPWIVSTVPESDQHLIRAQSPDDVDPAFRDMMEQSGSANRKSWHTQVQGAASQAPASPAQPSASEPFPSEFSLSPFQQTQLTPPKALSDEVLQPGNSPVFAPKLIVEDKLKIDGPSPNQVLADVLIEGNATIPATSLMRYIKARAGRTITRDQIREDINSLYSTKWFYTIEPVYRQSGKGLVLVYKVTELPILRSVEYVGNKHVKEKILAGITGLIPMHAFSVAANRESARRIQSHYKDKGYLYAEVTLQKGGSVDDREVIFDIQEGPKVKVASVKFSGNKDVSSAVLKLGRLTKGEILWKFGGQYDPTTIPADVAAIKRYYHNIGYFDIQVQAEQETSEDRSKVTVIFNIEEGQRYKIRYIVFEGNRIYSRDQLLKDFELEEGEFFSARVMAKDVESIQVKYGELGRLFAKVNSGNLNRAIKFTEKPGVLDLVYQIDEDRVYRIGMINVNIRGQHTHTKETVALNQLLIAPGELADPNKIRRSRARIGGSSTWERGGPDAPQINIRPVTNPSFTSRHVDPNPPVIRGSDGYFGDTTPQPAFVPEYRNSNSHNELILTNLKTKQTNESAGRARIINTIPGAGYTIYSPEPPAAVTPQTNSQNQRYYREYRKQRPDQKKLLLYQPLDFDNHSVFTETGNPFVQQFVAQTEAPVVRGQSVDQYAAPPSSRFNPNPLGSEFGPPVLNPELPPGYVDLDLNVTEARTGRFMLGASVNSDSGVFGNIVLEEQNFDIMRVPTSWRDVVDGYAFRGGGQQFRLEATPGNQVSRYLGSWTNPHFLDTDYSLGVSGFYYQRYFRDWNEQRTGGRINMGKMLTRELSINNALRLEKVNISDLRLNAPSLVPTLGDHFLGTYKFSLGYDTRDSASMATDGYNLQGSVEQAFADYSFTKLELQGSQYFTTYQRPDGEGKHVLSFRGNLGWTTDDTPSFERFYAGGFQTFRGFKFRSVGPLEPPNLGTNGAQVGGMFQMLGTAEYMLPVMASETVRLVAFTDFGTVEKNVSLENFRVSIGGGLRIAVPQMGPVPIALDWAFPIFKEETDIRQMFSFYIGLTR